MKKITNSLIFNNHHGVFLKDSGIVLPKVYHKIVITFAHLGHRRIRKTKPVLKSSFLFQYEEIS